MKTIDRKAKKPRAVPKSKTVTFEAVTGDGQTFFRNEIEHLQKEIIKLETEKDS